MLLEVDSEVVEEEGDFEVDVTLAAGVIEADMGHPLDGPTTESK